MSNQLSRLTESGLAEFEKFIRDTRDSENSHATILAVPNILATSSNVETLSSKVVVDSSLIFSNRFDFGSYLVDEFGGEFQENWYEDYGLWAWLALLYLTNEV